ncbi:aspartate dehydrogenase [archaeon]|nr:aspartate dehydrogenase [archaeon]
MKVAIIGCGFIGKTIAEAIHDGTIDGELVIVFSLKKSSAEKVGAICDDVVIADSLRDVLDSNADLVVEAASIDALKNYAIDILSSKKNLMAMSVGAFADGGFLKRVEKAARENKVKVYLPSGAIGGLDALKSAQAAELREVSIVTTKPPKSLAGNQYLRDSGIDVFKIKEKTVLYEGNASGAIEKFPKNVNVATTVGLAGLGPEKTSVKIICDPKIDKNIHEIHARGDFGEFTFRTENLPSPQNPKTSYLAALSAISTLKKITSHIDIGT